MSLTEHILAWTIGPIAVVLIGLAVTVAAVLLHYLVVGGWSHLTDRPERRRRRTR